MLLKPNSQYYLVDSRFDKTLLESAGLAGLLSFNDIVDISVETPSGKLGVKADLAQKKRLNYYYPKPLPKDFLFNVNGVEIERPIMEKYKYGK